VWIKVLYKLLGGQSEPKIIMISEQSSLAHAYS